MQQKSFIVNYDKLLSEVVNNILPKCDSVDMLVGYFYFSGYMELYESLRDKNVRILVGLDVDTNVKEVTEIARYKSDEVSRKQVREEFYQKLSTLCNQTDYIDDREREAAFRDFCGKIENGTLEVRKTDKSCHAKMYIFGYHAGVSEEGEQPGTVIVGSSNLTRNGVKGNLEINKRITDKTHYDDAETIFEELWKKSIEVLSVNKMEDFRKQVLQRTWVNQMFPPYEIYLRVLHEFFTLPEHKDILTPYDITKGKFSNLKYQSDAVKMALNALKSHNGAIIADVVGLGKSVIASTVAHNMQLRTLVICPPHLKNQWEIYKDDFTFRASVFSSGKIEDALARYDENEGEEHLIIVDEAHRFRNETTMDYALLHRLCCNNKVLLLTATPFNNHPADIYSMIKLFQQPTKTTLKTVESLQATFMSLIGAYKKLEKERRKGNLNEDELRKQAEEIASQIRSIIQPLVIRRSRLDLQKIPAYAQNLKEQGYEVLTPQAPKELNYDLEEQQSLYIDTLNRIKNKSEEKDEAEKPEGLEDEFKAARYAPILYVKAEYTEKLKKELKKEYDVELNMLKGRQMNVANFMRRLLVRRFESSVAAFKGSLEYMIASNKKLLSWVESSGRVPVFKKGNLPEVDDFYASNDDGENVISEEFEGYKERGFFDFSAEYLDENYLKDIRNDIDLLEDILVRWFGAHNNIKAITDYKLEQFKELVGNWMKREPNRKIVVFSEFADTVNYIGKALKDEDFPVISYTSGDASSKIKEEIRSNFDAGVKKKDQKDDYKILVATDAISEGYNLHRAGIILNYDIPYNPTRVIQRIGRINRINKRVFDQLYIYNFFPSAVGESDSKIKEISTLKMAMIHAIMGEDTKVLTSDEEVQSYFEKQYKSELAQDEVESWDVRFRCLLDDVKGTEEYKRALELPLRVRTGRKLKNKQKGVIVFGKKGQDFVFKLSDGQKVHSLSAEDALGLFEANKTEEAFKLSDEFYSKYQKAKDFLFVNAENENNSKTLLEAYKKVKLMIQSAKGVDKDYLKDLELLIKYDAFSGYELKQIKELAPKNYAKVKDIVLPEYMHRIFQMRKRIDEGEESLILSEELM